MATKINVNESLCDLCGLERTVCEWARDEAVLNQSALISGERIVPSSQLSRFYASTHMRFIASSRIRIHAYTRVRMGSCKKKLQIVIKS